MPLFYDPSNYRARPNNQPALMPRMDDAIEAPGLEAATGADWLASPLDVARCHNVAQIMAHLHEGAQLIQLKMLGDLASSVGERMNSSLMRMQTLTRNSAQCALLIAGVYAPDSVGNLYMGEVAHSDKPRIHLYAYTSTHATWAAVQTACNEWSGRGGNLLMPCPAVELLPSYLRAHLACLERMHTNRTKVVLPSKPDVPDVAIEVSGLQLLVDPGPTVRFFAAVPGIGPQRAMDAARFYCEQQGMSALDALAQMASPGGVHFRGWGKGLAAQLARTLALSLQPAHSIDNVEA